MRVKSERILFCVKVGDTTACLYVEKWIQEREDGCVKEGEVITGVKLLRRGGTLGRFPSVMRRQQRM